MGYRAVLEVLKFCDVCCLLHSADCVNRLWTSSCSSNELWDSLSETYHIPPRGSRPGKEWFRMCSCQHLPIVSKNHCALYSVPSLRSRTVLFFHDINVDCKSMWCPLNKANILCCGGELGLVTYKIILATRDVRPMGHMKQARCLAGIIKCKGLVYVIGGTLPHQRIHWYTGEKYDPVKNKWTLLRGKLDTWSINPSLSMFLNKIYVVSVYNQTVSVLNPETEQFTMLDVQLPVESASVCTVVIDHYMIILGSSAILKYDLQTWALVDQKAANFSSLWSNCPPVRCANYFFSFIYQIEGILRFDAETLAAEVVMKFN